VVAPDDDAPALAPLCHEREGRAIAAAPVREEARRVHGVAGEEERESREGQRAAPAPRAQLRPEDPREQDQEQRDPDQEVAQVDHLGAQPREDSRRRERDRDEPEHPEIVALAREADQPESEEPGREQRVEGGERPAHREPEREAERARDDLARDGRRSAAHREVAQVDGPERDEQQRRRGVQAEGIGECARRWTGAPREAQRRLRDRPAPEEQEDELREDPEAGRDGEQRGGSAPTALEEVQQREQGREREADRECVAAGLGGVVQQREARGGDRGGEQ